VEYDPAVVSYVQLLAVFTAERHVRKARRQYASAIWFDDAAQEAAARTALAERGLEGIVELAPAMEWHDAEEHHQDYNFKNSGAACLR